MLPPTRPLQPAGASGEECPASHDPDTWSGQPARARWGTRSGACVAVHLGYGSPAPTVPRWKGTTGGLVSAASHPTGGVHQGVGRWSSAAWGLRAEHGVSAAARSSRGWRSRVPWVAPPCSRSPRRRCSPSGGTRRSSSGCRRTSGRWEGRRARRPPSTGASWSGGRPRPAASSMRSPTTCRRRARRCGTSAPSAAATAQPGPSMAEWWWVTPRPRAAPSTRSPTTWTRPRRSCGTWGPSGERSVSLGRSAATSSSAGPTPGRASSTPSPTTSTRPSRR